jgi:hypothetical protein
MGAKALRSAAVGGGHSVAPIMMSRKNRVRTTSDTQKADT